MNAKTTRILKEARPLLWPWCAVAIAGWLPLVQPLHSIADISSIAFLAGIPLLATLSLGNEFQHRTLSLLLTQPVDRMEIWGEKLSVTVVAVLSAALVGFFGWRVGGNQLDPGELVLAGAWIIATIASATFWTLFARSTLGGLVLNGVVPSTFMIVAWGEWWHRIGGTEYLSPATITVVSISAFVLLCYAGVMLWLGRRMLARFQVTGGMAGDDLLMAGPDVTPEALAGWFRCRPTGAVLNLIRKELHVLRPLWLITLLAVLFWTWLTIRLIAERESTTILPGLTTGVLLAVSTALGAGKGKIIAADLLIAILAGCLSLGEERTSGTHSWHLTLPVPARRQWLIKLVMAMFAGFVCAVLLPTLVVTAVGFAFGSPFMLVDLRSEMVWLFAVLLLSFASFWCACAVSGTVRAALWVVPAMGAVFLASGYGDLMGQELAKITGTLRDFVVSWFQLSPLAFTSIQFTSDRVLISQSGLTLLWLFVPVLLLAVIQSYRLFRTQPQDSILWMIRCLLPLVLAAFLCSFLVSAGWAARWQPFSETQEAIEKLHTGGATAQLTVEDLAKVSPLSQFTRRWLRDASISVTPDKVHSGYFATIHLAGGLDCRLAVAHYGGRSFNPEEPSCAQKGP